MLEEANPCTKTKFYYVAYLEQSSNLWCWTFDNSSDRMIARNVEKYYNKADCLAAINVVKSIRVRRPSKERSAWDIHRPTPVRGRTGHE